MRFLTDHWFCGLLIINGFTEVLLIVLGSNALKAFFRSGAIPPLILGPNSRQAAELYVLEEETYALAGVAGLDPALPFSPWLPTGDTSRSIGVPRVQWVEECAQDICPTCELLPNMQGLLIRSGFVLNHEIASVCNSCISVDVAYSQLLDSMLANRADVNWLTGAACLLSPTGQRLLIEEQLEALVPDGIRALQLV